MNLCQCAVIGMGVMGSNLAMNIAEKGFTVAGYDLRYESTEKAVETARNQGLSLVPARTVEELCALLERPRRILLMITAGKPVDLALEALLPYLQEGDIVSDCGNSHFPDTVRRCKQLSEKGILFLGTGVSGGEEGARHGPAIMPGGDRKAWDAMAEILQSISAVAEGEPCCDYMGPDGAGHFVKMVHNGIEYADMQLICEAYELLKANHSEEELSRIFASWNEGELDSYLIEITADILSQRDPETNLPMTQVILDRAGQKGTGIWTSQHALSLGVAAPTVTEAVYARAMSASKSLRVTASPLFPGPEASDPGEGFEESVRRALYASKICAYAQGFALYAQASSEFGWNLDLGRIAMLFRGGCIIRARFLSRIKEAYARNPDLPNLVLDPYFAGILGEYLPDLRRVCAYAALSGTAIPAFSSALSWFDMLRSSRMPHNLLQAQRDYFGAHTFERTDKEGFFHHIWQ